MHPFHCYSGHSLLLCSLVQFCHHDLLGFYGRVSPALLGTPANNTDRQIVRLRHIAVSTVSYHNLFDNLRAMYSATANASPKNAVFHFIVFDCSCFIASSQRLSATANCWCKPSICVCIALVLHSFGNDCSNATIELCVASIASWFPVCVPQDDNINNANNNPYHLITVPFVAFDSLILHRSLTEFLVSVRFQRCVLLPL